MVTATSARRTVPPLLKPNVSMPSFSAQWFMRSKMPTTGTPSSRAMATVSSAWSKWPWVSRM